jgi:hypothetical protein
MIPIPAAGNLQLLCPNNFQVDFSRILLDHTVVKVDATRKAKSEADLLDQATAQLLRSIKQKISKKQSRVDYAKLRKEGYSERFLARLEDA